MKARWKFCLIGTCLLGLLLLIVALVARSHSALELLVALLLILGIAALASFVAWQELKRRNRAEAAHIASEIRFRRLFEAARDGILILDAQAGIIQEVNPFLVELLGISREDILGKRLFELGFFRDIIANKNAFEELQRNEYIRYEDKPLQTASGHSVAVEFVSNVYLVDDQKVIQCNIRDVSERVRTAEIMRASAARYRTLLESIPQNIMIKDTACRYVSINELYARRLGIAPDEVIGKVDFDFFPKALAEKYQSDDKRVMATGETREFDESFSRDGKENWIHTVKTPVRDETGKVIGVLVSFWDVTDRKIAEERIHLQAMVLEATANAIIVTDIDGTIEWVNPAFSAFTGYSLDEAVGKNPRDLVRSGSHDTAFYQEMWKTITAGLVWQGEVTNRRKDGTLYTEVQTITPIRDNAGAIRHFVGVKLDVSERRKLEQELAQAQKMESVGRLAGGVAHDFNNLLTVISGYTEMVLAAVPEDDKKHEDLIQIYKAAERAGSLTRQLLAFSRRQVLRPKVIDLNHVIADCTKLLQRLIGEDIAFVVKPGKGLWLVMADPGQIEQIIMNLVVNARDAMPLGGSIVVETDNSTTEDRISTKHLSMEAGSYVCLAVSDTGIGMDKATQGKIFEPFFTTKEVGRGTGLGLATVYGIIKQSGGNIFVYSEPGKGTTFKIYLPRILVNETIQSNDTVASEILSGTETILLVEDEEPLRMLTERILKQAGYTVLSASNGASALEMVEQHKSVIHLVLTDVIMPGIGGRELVNRLKEKHPDYKILYMSGYTDAAIAVHGVLEPGTQLLGKPYTASHLTHKVREVLESCSN